MELERFLKITLGLQKEIRRSQKLAKLELDLVEYSDLYYVIIGELVKEVWGEEGADWFWWFCLESDFGQKDWSKGGGEVRFGAHDENGNPICYSHESTWEYLEANYNKKRNE